ncbi:GTPase IMAP family member 8-like [Onychostoma macrolepis]|uniref:GTPase IMAP family member 8-like n=1 Tax=Onychostoma macrolepis TaxID=369639 RepID=UPI00272D4FC0|nr:GTPase IMAP family member 8-like [Onychostoma macrolepis]XP_058617233.1 GTPase IMAP family member 8-like [Onychostoma macrolepis]XP_058617234.1 GTPase IMAP family member 8-like [Onychostoma macrolepis]XP_058617235.1 GTPase IMAP family member 8-like [Onychostoma macrolepis]XP_058617236.1 GTPase IMAP family member 8-like [Onychostoma macrolepis]XP_058617237.1 GTPase IMAP family member 8-like [Onychostoma macrolepis]XP_058617238.1 GTPase IMAP family member 8-like [Onychostoma macrolepis]XP_0
MAEMIRGLNLVLLGRTGIGKSASGNTILGREAFKSKKSSASVTRDVAVESGIVCGRWLTVYDTPGLFNTEMSDHEIQYKLHETLQRCDSGLCVFLLVIKADRFTGKERKTVEKIEQLLGDERLKKTWILFTGGDELEEENTTIEEYINLSEPLKKVVQKYDQRYHVFNNKTRGPSEQVRLLLEKIKDAPADSLSSRRLVLLGESGVGKSAAGNTILGQREFISVMRMSSVTSECSEAHVTVSGRSETVERLRAARRQRYEENRKRREIERMMMEEEEDRKRREEIERVRAARQRYEENRKRREIERMKEFERVRAARQREEENRKQQEELERRQKETCVCS